MPQETRMLWKKWSATLKAWQGLEFTADLLEIGGSFSIIAAQLVYIGQPILSSLLPNHELLSIANILEEPTLRKDFINFLREENA
ncbi:MAG: hypothetical protein N2D54_11020 [Chloroflexota bacterium]